MVSLLGGGAMDSTCSALKDMYYVTHQSLKLSLLKVLVQVGFALREYPHKTLIRVGHSSFSSFSLPYVCFQSPQVVDTVLVVLISTSEMIAPELCEA